MIDLQKYCDGENGRSQLRTPWSAGEYSFATNGHILVRVPRIAEIAEREDAPRTAKVVQIPDKPLEPLSWGDIPCGTIDPCSFCCALGSKAPCGCTCVCCCCEMCDGTGFYEQRLYGEISGVVFDARYIRWLVELGVAEGCIVPSLEYKTSRPSFFRGPGVEVWLMPCVTEATFNALKPDTGAAA